LLDENVVSLGLSLPHRLKTNGRTGKRVLRDLAQRWLPRSVAVHPKHGFQIPLDVMSPPALHDALHDLLLGATSRTRAVFDGALVRRWLKAFRERVAGGMVSRGGIYQRVITAL